MSRLLVALCAFVFASAPALAGDNDTKPVSKMTTEQAKAARAEAKAKWDQMTPEQKATVSEKLAGKKVQDLTALEELAVPRVATTPSGTPLIGGWPAGREVEKAPKTTPEAKQPATQ